MLNAFAEIFSIHDCVEVRISPEKGLLPSICLGTIFG